MLLFSHMDKIRKPKKSPYYFANIVLLVIILFVLIGYLNKLNSIAKNKNQDNTKYEFSTFENKKDFEKENILENTQKNTNENKTHENILIKEGKYVRIIKSCDIHFSGSCVRARSCPSLECPTVVDLRNNMILKTDGEIIDFGGIRWYHIVFDEWVRYPDRTARDWYISSDYLQEISSYTEKLINDKNVTTSVKKILVNLKDQKLYAYNGENKVMEFLISSGLDDLPTPIGTFKIFQKTPSRYMQGPLPGISDQEYDLPGVPWTMYFTNSGAAIHGAYWHNSFGEQWSHGCINLDPSDAERLYSWAEVGTQVIVEK
ncbi:MAG: hypothetical protein QG630_488 [Patescibacteria group bacterium]|nr:hypothetical protein [Patescibacteria group bacterium]